MKKTLSALIIGFISVILLCAVAYAQNENYAPDWQQYNGPEIYQTIQSPWSQSIPNGQFEAYQRSMLGNRVLSNIGSSYAASANYLYAAPLTQYYNGLASSAGSTYEAVRYDNSNTISFGLPFSTYVLFESPRLIGYPSVSSDTIRSNITVMTGQYDMNLQPASGWTNIAPYLAVPAMTQADFEREIMKPQMLESNFGEYAGFNSGMWQAYNPYIIPKPWYD